MHLPEGLRVVQAWSAYGTVVQAGEREVVSRERTSSRQSSWIVVQARVQPGAAPLLSVQGEMSWDGGTLLASPLVVGTR